MAELDLGGTQFGTALADVLNADDIVPGTPPGYQTCKALLTYHPLGQKMAESPVTKAQSQKRSIEIPGAPDDVKTAFEDEWKAIGADRTIKNAMRIARAYGVSGLAVNTVGKSPDTELDFKTLAKQTLSFSVFDPLNMAGSMVTNQNPNDPHFQKALDVHVQGQAWHRSRLMITTNEDPVYLDYTVSAFGYVGRSVYQRALYPLKTFLQTMRTDDLIVRKAGVLVAKLKPTSSITDRVMASMAGMKRAIVKQAKNDDVISISTDEDIQSLNFQNLEGPYTVARKNCIQNVATAADMPAVLINQETFAEGFGEGTEDAKAVSNYIDGVREDMQHLYEFFDQIVQHRAWNEEFYKIMQGKYPEEYKDVDYNTAFYLWKNNFTAEWPNLLEEPDSAKINVDKTRFDAALAAVQTLLPLLDPDNKAAMIEWLCDLFNSQELLFPSKLELDADAIANFDPQAAMNGGQGGDPNDPTAQQGGDPAAMGQDQDGQNGQGQEQAEPAQESDPNRVADAVSTLEGLGWKGVNYHPIPGVLGQRAKAGRALMGAR